MPTTALMPLPKQQFLSILGTPLVGGKVYTYAAGTTNPKATYTDAAGTTPQANPIILNLRGEPDSAIYWSGAYKVEVRDALNNLVYTVDNFNTDPAGVWGMLTTLATSAGASLVGYILDAAGAVAKTIQRKLRNRVEVFDFMTEAQITDVQARTLTVDVTAAMQAARDYIATTRKKLVFPPGAYLYSKSPNWAIHHSEVIFEGDVTLRYTGTGDAVIFDANAADAVVEVAGLCYAPRWGWTNRPTIEAPSTAGNGVYVRSVHHGMIGARVRGCGSTSAGLKVQFAVCSGFDIVVSGNENGWYSGAKPAIGINLDRRNAGETTSYCYFPNPVIEGPTIGIQLTATLGNNFIGGTSEACSQYGVYASPSAAQDKFYGTDFEVNTLADVYDMGTGLVLDNCDSYTQTTLGTQSKNATIRGGRYSKVLSDTGSLRATIKDIVFNRFNDGSTLVDAGTGTLLDNCRNGGTNTTYLTGTLAVGAVAQANNTLGVNSITVTGAKLGDFAMVAFDAGGLGQLIVWGQVTALNTVTAYTYNNTGALVNIPAGNWRATVFRR